MRPFLSGLLAACMLLIGLAAAAQAGETRFDTPGDYRFEISHDGLDRLFRVHVPRSARAPAPVVLALHGGGGNMDVMGRDDFYGLISASEAEGFILVLPNGASRFRSGKLATWNAGLCCARARDLDIDDVGFLRTVIETVTADKAAAPSRVFVIGMSNGAMMAYRLACEIPGMLRGIMAVAGTDTTHDCAPDAPIAILHIHARDDDHVQFGGGAGPAAVRAALITDYVAVPEVIARWVERNRAEPTPRRVLESDGAACDLYPARPGGAPVQLCVTEEGGHSWPGGGARRGKTPSRALRANDVMWRFFSGL